MASGTIVIPVEDVLYVESVGTTTFTLNGHYTANPIASGYVDDVVVPTGYQKLLYGVKANGDANVCSVGMNNNWLNNTSDNTSRSITATVWALCVKQRGHSA